eukprot:GHVQ01025138.1.p1 GENE.GHVQ01025138.1~~GHVQ01025138.1.p1  ORF type:complete len:390 (-),score=46.27 GHVQ01025138.1:788-1957(-)
MSYTASDMSYLHNHNPHHHNGQTDMRAVGSYVESLSSPPPPDSTQPAETSLSPSAPIYFHYFHTAFSDLGEFWTSAPSLEAMFFKKVFGAPLHLKPLSFPHVSAFSGLELPYAAFHSVTENQEKLPDESIKLCEWSNGELMQKIGEMTWRHHRHLARFHPEPYTFHPTSSQLMPLLTDDGSTNKRHSNQANEVKYELTDLQTALGIGIYLHSQKQQSQDTAEAMAYSIMVNSEMSVLLLHILWLNEDTFRHFTRPLYSQSMPLLFSYVSIWRNWKTAEARCAQEGLMSQEAVLFRLEKVLRSLGSYLGDRTWFSQTNRPSFLDADVFSYLSILYSLPTSCDKKYFKILSSVPSLIEYCRDMNNRFRICWNHRLGLEFLCSLPGGPLRCT